MSYGIFLVAVAHSGAQIGQWLRSYDGPECPFGYRKAVLTTDPAEAMKFESVSAAVAFWHQRSEAVPTRPDGKPNRPLTSCTALFEKLP